MTPLIPALQNVGPVHLAPHRPLWLPTGDFTSASGKTQPPLPMCCFTLCPPLDVVKLCSSSRSCYSWTFVSVAVILTKNQVIFSYKLDIRLPLTPKHNFPYVFWGIWVLYLIKESLYYAQWVHHGTNTSRVQSCIPTVSKNFPKMCSWVCSFGFEHRQSGLHWVITQFM